MCLVIYFILLYFTANRANVTFFEMNKMLQLYPLTFSLFVSNDKLLWKESASITSSCIWEVTCVHGNIEASFQFSSLYT